MCIKYVLMVAQTWLPAAALEADLNLGGVLWAQRGGAKQRAKTSFGSCISLPSAAVEKPLFMPVVAAEMLSRKVFWGIIQ